MWDLSVTSSSLQKASLLGRVWLYPISMYVFVDKGQPPLPHSPFHGPYYWLSLKYKDAHLHDILNYWSNAVIYLYYVGGAIMWVGPLCGWCHHGVNEAANSLQATMNWIIQHLWIYGFVSNKYLSSQVNIKSISSSATSWKLDRNYNVN